MSVQTWMALGMSRAVFSLVIEQISFKRTVSCSQSHAERGRQRKNTGKDEGDNGKSAYKAMSADLPARNMCSSVTALPVSPSGRCCCKSRSSFQRGRGGPAGECLFAARMSNLWVDNRWPFRSIKIRRWDSLKVRISSSSEATQRSAAESQRQSQKELSHSCCSVQWV